MSNKKLAIIVQVSVTTEVPGSEPVITKPWIVVGEFRETKKGKKIATLTTGLPAGTAIMLVEKSES